MSGNRIRIAVLTALAGATALSHAQAWSLGGGTISGLVRTQNGTPQMGVLIQVFSPDATSIATAVTDLRGRYRISNIHPGSYRLLATSAMFLPAQKDNLKIQIGSKSVVDLTMATLFSVSEWLPAHRRAAEEPGDDWMWTLRSTANRPLLRLHEDDDNSPAAVSSSRQENGRGAASTSGRVAMTSDDNGFAHGGTHQTLNIDRLQGDGTAQMMYASFSGARTPYPVAPSADLTAGIEGKVGLNGYSRVMMTYHSHPELVAHRSTSGMQAATLRSAHRVQFGEFAMIDGGSMLREINFAGNSTTMLPFVSISVRPAEHVVLTYGYATSPEMQSLDDLDRVQVELPVAYSVNGKLRTEKTAHNSLSLAVHSQRTVVEFAVYHDRIGRERISGIGVLNAGEIDAGGVVADPTTQSFRAVSQSFVSEGYHAAVHHKITNGLTLSGQYATGFALVAAPTASAADLNAVLGSLHRVSTQSASFSLNGRIAKTGTRLRTGYRWQPEHTLTSVDRFQTYGDPSYVSIHLRQPLRIHGILPDGLEAVLDVNNLLAQGYQSFVSCDGRTLYLAQTPRALQAGLAFTF